jgi:hypothetical protein
MEIWGNNLSEMIKHETDAFEVSLPEGNSQQTCGLKQPKCGFSQQKMML